MAKNRVFTGLPLRKIVSRVDRGRYRCLKSKSRQQKFRSKIFLECYNTEFRRDKIWKFDYYLI